jgi:hypothetical protein
MSRAGTLYQYAAEICEEKIWKI